MRLTIKRTHSLIYWMVCIVKWTLNAWTRTCLQRHRLKRTRSRDMHLRASPPLFSSLPVVLRRVRVLLPSGSVEVEVGVLVHSIHWSPTLFSVHGFTRCDVRVCVCVQRPVQRGAQVRAAAQWAALRRQDRGPHAARLLARPLARRCACPCPMAPPPHPHELGALLLLCGCVCVLRESRLAHWEPRRYN